VRGEREAVSGPPLFLSNVAYALVAVQSFCGPADRRGAAELSGRNLDTTKRHRLALLRPRGNGRLRSGGGIVRRCGIWTATVNSQWRQLFSRAQPFFDDAGTPASSSEAPMTRRIPSSCASAPIPTAWRRSSSRSPSTRRFEAHPSASRSNSDTTTWSSSESSRRTSTTPSPRTRRSACGDAHPAGLRSAGSD
jgi:hypothetical protein